MIFAMHHLEHLLAFPKTEQGFRYYVATNAHAVLECVASEQVSCGESTLDFQCLDEHPSSDRFYRNVDVEVHGMHKGSSRPVEQVEQLVGSERYAVLDEKAG